MAENPAKSAPSSVSAPDTIELPAEFEALSQRLVADPRLVNADPQQLANETGLAASFVADVQAAMQSRSAVDSRRFDLWLVIREAGFALIEQFKRMRASWERHSMAWLVGAAVLFGLIFLTNGLLAEGTLSRQISRGLVVTSLGLMFICHIGIWMVRGMARYAAYAGIALTLTFFCATFLIEGGASGGIELALFASTILGFLYFLFGLAFSVAGGYRRLRREARSEVGTRQEILGRLFDVEAMLARQDPTRLTGDQQVWYARLRRPPTIFFAGAVAGITVGLLDVLGQAVIFRVTGRPLLSETPEASMAMVIYALAAIPFTLGGYILTAFLAGSFGRGLVTALLFYYMHAACYALPVEPLGIDAWRLYMAPERQWPGVIMVMICTLIGVLAAQVQVLLTQRNRRQGRSPAALLAERVMLQRRLNLGRQATCVLVVDVARSTKMKDGADPLKVEWSFREYQALVATVGAAHGGEVLSTAGDGAVLLFARAGDAVQAARSIQTEIGAFNQRRNRMSQPFRLRIGLHLGETTSDLAQAPFHEVIDKAAHIESVAPIGGIALSGRVAAEVPELQVVALANRIDDEEVMVVLNPTLDPDAE